MHVIVMVFHKVCSVLGGALNSAKGEHSRPPISPLHLFNRLSFLFYVVLLCKVLGLAQEASLLVPGTGLSQQIIEAPGR